MNILICDDDKDIRKQLSEYLSENPSHTVYTADNSKAISEHLQDTEIHLLITDIELSGENGILIAEKLQQSHPDMKVLFISGYGDTYYPDIFKAVNPCGFLEKPIQYYSLDFYVQQVEKSYNERNAKITITSNHRKHMIPVSDILYFHSIRRKCEIITSGEVYSCYKKLSEFEACLPSHFVQCHNGYIVNLKYVRSYQVNHFQMINDEIIPISDNHLQLTRTAYYQNS